MIQDLLLHLRQDFVDELKNDIITTLKEELKASLTEDLKQTLFTELRLELLKDITEHFPALPKNENLQNPLQSGDSSQRMYSDIARSVPSSKSTLMIHPKNKTRPADIRAQLHQFSKQDIGLINCFNTPTDKIIVQRKDETRLENLKNLIESTETLKDSSQLTKPQPRKLKIIIFGAPRTPPLSKQKDTNPTNELNEYLRDFVTPALTKLLHKEINNDAYRLIVSIKADRDSSHLVLELQEDARQLLYTGKILIGFNNCRIERYINIVRCFNCQSYHHTANNCKYPTSCGVCGGNHKTGSLRNDTTPICNEKQRYINCEAELAVEREEGFRSPKISLAHKTWEKGKCYAYKKHLDLLKSKQDNKPPH